MTNKEKYQLFCEKVYVPIYSKPWWMDAVCGEENWDVWLYEKGDNILAAMPYYKEKRQKYNYITKAPLTQNNGIIFAYPTDEKMKNIAKQKFEEEVIEHACQFIETLYLDVYEQQYHYQFGYYLPFFWNRYTCIPRITYVIEDTSDIERMWSEMSSNYRKNVKKGMKNSIIKEGLSEKQFYIEHERVFRRQNLVCPFGYDLWRRLYKTCVQNNACKIMYAETQNAEIASVLFIVWDEQSMYHLLGGSMPGYQQLATYNALTWQAICMASDMGIKYDFEGSVIKNISKSFREYGGTPKLYYRIRKVFNSDILNMEHLQQQKILEEKVSQETTINVE